MRKIDPERIERAARIYASNQEASQALGIAPGSFSRLCRAYAVETPYARKRRRRQECRHRHLVRRSLEDHLAGSDVELPELELDLDLEDVVAAEAELQGVL